MKETPIRQINKSVYDKMLNEIRSKYCYSWDMEYDWMALIRITEDLEPILEKYLSTNIEWIKKQ